MENQVNAGNQNTQQIGKNPVNQPAMTPEKPKTNYLMIAGIILACFVVFGFGGFYLGQQSSNKNSSTIENNQKTISGTPTSFPSTTFAPSPINSVSSSTLKTYSIEDLGISFQYPAQYSLLDKTGGGYDVYLFFSKEQQQKFEKCLVDKIPECNLYNIAIRIILQDKSLQQTLEQFYTQIGGQNVATGRKTIIDGRQALIFEGEGIGLIHTTYIDLGEDAFEIFGNAIVDDQASMSIYREIVKSIKITGR